MSTNSETVDLTFDNQLADHLAAERLYYKTTVFWKLDRVVAAVLVVFGAYLTWQVGPRWWSLIWFPLAVAEWFNLPSLRELQIRYWFKHNPKFRDTYHLTFSSTGIRFRTAAIDSIIRWSHYTGMLEDSRVVLLVYGPRMYTVIPKRVFDSEGESGQFSALVAYNLGKGRGSG